MNARSVKAWLLPRGSTLFKGRPPHSNPQASWAKSPPMSSRVLTLRHGGWVPHVMRADPKRKKPNRHTRSMQPPRGYKHSLILAETSGRKGGPRRRKHATAPRLCTLSALSHPTVQQGGPGPHVMYPARRLLRARKPHRHLRHCHVSSTAEPVPRLEAALCVTPQCQLSATIMGQSAAGIGATVDMAKSGPTIIAATDARKRRSNHLQARILS
jgi:hypothetical protein